MTSHPEIKCSHCGNPMVRNVAGIFSQGTQVGRYQEDPIFGLEGGSVTTTSLEARRLSPPGRPVPPSNTLLIIGMIVIPFGGVLSFTYLPSLVGGESQVPLFVAVGFTLIGLILIAKHYLSLPLRQANHELETKRWERQMTVWQNLVHCSRCDFVSDPVAERAVPTASVPELLNALENPADYSASTTVPTQSPNPIR